MLFNVGCLPRLKFELMWPENQKLYHRCGRVPMHSIPHSDRTERRILLRPALVAQRIEHLTTDRFSIFAVLTCKILIVNRRCAPNQMLKIGSCRCVSWALSSASAEGWRAHKPITQARGVWRSQAADHLPCGGRPGRVRTRPTVDRSRRVAHQRADPIRRAIRTRGHVRARQVAASVAAARDPRSDARGR